MHIKILLDCQVILLSAVIGHMEKVAISIITFTEQVNGSPPPLTSATNMHACLITYIIPMHGV